MKQKQFRSEIAKYMEEKCGRFLPLLIHQKKYIYLLAEYPASSSSSEMAESLIDYVFIDDKKKRVFYVGKAEELKRGWLAKKTPLEMKLKDFREWAEADSVKCDDYEVYFAWNYEKKDLSVFDYIPLSGKIEADPRPEKLDGFVFSSVEDAKAFKVNAKNLHESLKRLRAKK